MQDQIGFESDFKPPPNVVAIQIVKNKSGYGKNEIWARSLNRKYDGLVTE